MAIGLGTVTSAVRRPTVPAATVLLALARAISGRDGVSFPALVTRRRAGPVGARTDG
jgi:hypothetical protein